MEITVVNNKLKEALENPNAAQKRYGKEMAKKLHLRRDALAAAESLADFWPPNKKPERVHELQGARAGTFSVDLVHPHRLLFTAIDAVAHEDERIRWQSIKKIAIVSIEDTHG